MLVLIDVVGPELWTVHTLIMRLLANNNTTTHLLVLPCVSLTSVVRAFAKLLI